MTRLLVGLISFCLLTYQVAVASTFENALAIHAFNEEFIQNFETSSGKQKYMRPLLQKLTNQEDRAYVNEVLGSWKKPKEMSFHSFLNNLEVKWNGKTFLTISGIQRNPAQIVLNRKVITFNKNVSLKRALIEAIAGSQKTKMKVWHTILINDSNALEANECLQTFRRSPEGDGDKCGSLPVSFLYMMKFSGPVDAPRNMESYEGIPDALRNFIKSEPLVANWFDPRNQEVAIKCPKDDTPLTINRKNPIPYVLEKSNQQSGSQTPTVNVALDIEARTDGLVILKSQGAGYPNMGEANYCFQFPRYDGIKVEGQPKFVGYSPQFERMGVLDSSGKCQFRPTKFAENMLAPETKDMSDSDKIQRSQMQNGLKMSLVKTAYFSLYLAHCCKDKGCPKKVLGDGDGDAKFKFDADSDSTQ